MSQSETVRRVETRREMRDRMDREDCTSHMAQAQACLDAGQYRQGLSHLRHVGFIVEAISKRDNEPARGPTATQWAAALAIVALARTVLLSMVGDEPIPSAALSDAVDHFDEVTGGEYDV